MFTFLKDITAQIPVVNWVRLQIFLVNIFKFVVQIVISEN